MNTALRSTWITGVIMLLTLQASQLWALSSANIPLDSPIYSYLDKLEGFGLIDSSIKGIKPFSKAEAARLVLEAARNIAAQEAAAPAFAVDLVARLRELLPREVFLQKNPDKKPPLLDMNPVASLRNRYVYLDGVPRSYVRQVHDPGGDGVFGIGSGLRPYNTYPAPVNQRGSEGTPLFENNNGVVYRSGHNVEMLWAAEGYISDMITGLVEPVVAYSSSGSDSSLDLNRGYVKLGGGSLELEAGKDENWLGLGYRGNITLTNNAENLILVKLSSPEPVKVNYIGPMKYALIGSRFDETVVNGFERQPWFLALKLSVKPVSNLEIGLNVGRQVGGPGVDSSVSGILRGVSGGSGADNSNGLAGIEARYRIPWLRNTEFYGEFSGEDTAGVWPIVESYVAGFYIPRLSEAGRDDLRFEFFQGNQILYTHDVFPAGYIYKNMPLGHSQGGATQDFFTRYSHWFGVRNNLALEYIYTNRGMIGRMPGQAIERKHAGRAAWTLPIHGDVDALLLYGVERVTNLNLVGGADRTNQLLRIELRYRY